MEKILFSKKVTCGYCNKNHKAKKVRGGKRSYICSSYDNFGTCKRNRINQSQLAELLQLRYRDEFDINTIGDKVESIIVTEEKVVISVVDGEDIVESYDFLQL